MDEIYQKLDHLEVLIIRNGDFMFPFKVDPLPFTTHLKKLFIPMFQKERSCLTATNTIWILSFCSNLKEASIGFTVSTTDYKFISEYQPTFTHLSNIKHLALAFKFIFDENNRKTWWGLPFEWAQTWEGGRESNKKTSTIYQFLTLLNENLTSLELIETIPSTNPGDETKLITNCLLGLSKSYQSLKNLRICGLSATAQDPEEGEAISGIDLFKNLESLTLESHLLQTPTLFSKVSPSVNIVVLPFCFFQSVSRH